MTIYRIDNNGRSLVYRVNTGSRGADGVSSYLHLAFADDNIGTGFNFIDGVYIGTLVDTEITSSDDKNKNEQEPDIFIESGRFIAANHAVLVAPVLELLSQEYDEKALKLKDSNPPLIQELYDLYESVSEKTAIEYLHDSFDHMESLLTLFDLGYIDLQDRSNTEVLVHLITKKVLKLLKHKNYNEIIAIQEQVQERYLLNCSFLPLWNLHYALLFHNRYCFFRSLLFSNSSICRRISIITKATLHTFFSCNSS